MIADKSINLDTLYKVLFDNEKLELSKECIRKVEESFDFLQSFSSDKIIYGINTGFGPMAQYRIEDQSLIELQYNIIRSHSTGAGKPLPELYVKAAMIARLYTFLQGKSGVHMELVSLLCEFINRGIYPFIPEHGSVGASGDLVQLAHIALTLIGEGEVFYQGKLRAKRRADDDRQYGKRSATFFNAHPRRIIRHKRYFCDDRNRYRQSDLCQKAAPLVGSRFCHDE